MVKMKIKLHVFSRAVLILVYLISINCTNGVILTITQFGQRLNISGPILTYIGQQQCVRECLKEGGCESVNYCRFLLRCQLNPATVGPGVGLLPDHGCIYLEKATQPQELAMGSCQSSVCPFKCTQLSSGATSCTHVVSGGIQVPVTNPTSQIATSQFPTTTTMYPPPAPMTGTTSQFPTTTTTYPPPAPTTGMTSQFPTTTTTYPPPAPTTGMTSQFPTTTTTYSPPVPTTGMTSQFPTTTTTYPPPTTGMTSQFPTTTTTYSPSAPTTGMTSQFPTTTTTYSPPVPTTGMTSQFPTTTTTYPPSAPTTGMTSQFPTTTTTYPPPIPTTGLTSQFPTTTTTYPPPAPTTGMTSQFPTTTTTYPPPTPTTGMTSQFPTTTTTYPPPTPTTGMTSQFPTTTTTYPPSAPTTGMTSQFPTTTTTTSTISTTGSWSCPPPFIWKPAENLCYYNNENSLSWIQAKNTCQGMGSGARLAILDTHDKINSVLNDYGMGYLNYHQYFIGGHFNDLAGTWKWISGMNVDQAFLVFYNIPDKPGDCLIWDDIGLLHYYKCTINRPSLCEIPN
ncbi:mucin-5AC-like [Saccostrea cucullata]|uniref:mucin-5AC-like n=1 Tax=Saccostrea cuccullata TaxID=36930 RepID=UPI002ED5C1AF